jgi:hypothetical protein
MGNLPERIFLRTALSEMVVVDCRPAKTRKMPSGTVSVAANEGGFAGQRAFAPRGEVVDRQIKEIGASPTERNQSHVARRTNVLAQGASVQALGAGIRSFNRWKRQSAIETGTLFLSEND